MQNNFQICKYKNDSQTAVTLMIDDLAPVAVTPNGELKPQYDHGFGKKNPNGLFHYFEKHFLELFPEAKGTFFVLTEKHFMHNKATGYTLLDHGFDDEYFEFLNSLQSRFDFAFHGTTHGKMVNGKIEQEFTYRSLADVFELKKSMQNFEEKSGIDLTGGKFPGYMSNSKSDDIIEQLGLKWWCFHNRMKNKKSPDNAPSFYGKENKVMRFPTNFSGDNFKQFLRKDKMGLKSWYGFYRKTKLQAHLQYLYENEHIISIQEHFTTLRTDGQYQRPNVFDDLESLKMIYGILRGADIWHAGCDAIAKYVENREEQKIEFDGKTLKLSYAGRYQNSSVSVKSKTVKTLKNEKGETLNAFYKNGHWVFSELTPGEYQIT